MAGWSIPSVVEAHRRADRLRLPNSMLIGDDWCHAASGSTLDVINPFTEKVIGTVPAGDEVDVARSVEVAQSTFENGPWRRMSTRDRGRALLRVAELLQQHQEEFALLECLENGKPIRESQWAGPAAAGVFEYYGGWADKYHGEVVPLGLPHLNLVVNEPVGVIGGITPWNFPTTQPSFKIAPAIAMGNSVVLKPAEQCSLPALKLAELCLAADIPPGVVNVVTGYGETAGAALTTSPGVDAISFTGSTETGRLVMSAASGTLKRISLECGGKTPNIVFADADLDAAVAGSIFGAFYNQGEVCNAGSRLLVEEHIYDEFLERLTQGTHALKLGDPMAADTELGCLVSGEQLQRTLDYIDIGVADGATLHMGGSRWGDQGFFVEGTIFTDVSPQMRIYQEEIFGPVVTVTKFRCDDEAVRLANDSAYGLAAGLWTRDVNRAHSIAGRLQTGTVWVNDFGPFDIASPWTGYKQSGFGTEWGRNMLDFVTIPKSIWIARDFG